jgi:hypothetical protein
MDNISGKGSYPNSRSQQEQCSLEENCIVGTLARRVEAFGQKSMQVAMVKTEKIQAKNLELHLMSHRSLPTDFM